MLEQMGHLTLEDLQKEMLYRELPREVQHQMILTFPSDSLLQLGEKADLYFETDGRTKQVAASRQHEVSSISSTPYGFLPGSSDLSEGPMGYVANSARADQAHFTSPFGSSDFSEEPVNAIGRNVQRNLIKPRSSSSGGQQQVRGRSRARSRDRSRPAPPRAPTPSADWKYAIPTTYELGTPDPDGLYRGLCWYHARFGTDAKRCNEPTCKHHHRLQGNSNRGRR